MSYQIIVPNPVRKQLDELPIEIRDRIIRKVITLKDDPRPRGCVKLKGFKNEYRIRVGDYRVRYEIRDHESIVILLHCGHRGRVYKRG